MNRDQLTIGKVYQISCNASDPSASYFGPARLIGFDPSDYPEGTLEFVVLDGSGENGYFRANEVVREIEGAASVTGYDAVLAKLVQVRELLTGACSADAATKLTGAQAVDDVIKLAGQLQDALTLADANLSAIHAKLDLTHDCHDLPLDKLDRLIENSVVLEAWQAAFGTTQLTHAVAIFEHAKKKAVRLVEDRDKFRPLTFGMAARDWAPCPVCGEPDARHEADAEGNKLITCVNHACASNGGVNSSALEAARPENQVQI